MPAQVITSVENNFTKGLVTEFTGLNFPENAATDSDNIEFSIIGDVERRIGINYETNNVSTVVDKTNKAISSYKWDNAGGDGLVQVVVTQVGSTLNFYRSSSATVTSPLSANKLVATIDITPFSVSDPSTSECQYADGNGYLFVYNPKCDPFYCSYSAGTIVANAITIKTRDFVGVPELNTPFNFRPPALSDAHYYNLTNQGWQSPVAWQATSTSPPIFIVDGNGNYSITTSSFQITAGLPIVGGSYVTLYGTMVFSFLSAAATIQGTVSSYIGTTLTIIPYSVIFSPQVKAAGNSLTSANWTITPAAGTNQISTWFSAIGNYPSNADVWWIYKNTTGIFDPAATINNFPAPISPASKGHYILDEFNQNRALLSGKTTLSNITTTKRPRTGAWFQGRVWYAGVDDSVPAQGTAPYTTWTECIYFSQIINSPEQFGYCYQENDPTDQNLFDILSTDGGVIRLPGIGSIYKLVPVGNGLFVFGANGIRFITGSQGIGFSATDYTILDISKIRCLSSTSFINVNGLPYFWNEEGIYMIQPVQGGAGFEVNSITVSTIRTFFQDIPLSSKCYARAAYDPINYEIRWLYKNTEAVSVTDRYKFNKMITYSTFNKAFSVHTIDNTSKAINSIVYVSSPAGGLNVPEPMFKYVAGDNTTVTFADKHDLTYVDWGSIDYTSYFYTGYKLHGQAQRRFQIPYIYVFSDNSTDTFAYKIQGVWDYAIDRNSNRWSTAQIIRGWKPKYGVIFKRHRIRGQGLVLQIKVSSVTGQPFKIIGWSSFEVQNTGV